MTEPPVFESWDLSFCKLLGPVICGLQGVITTYMSIKYPYGRGPVCQILKRLFWPRFERRTHSIVPFLTGPEWLFISVS